MPFSSYLTLNSITAEARLTKFLQQVDLSLVHLTGVYGLDSDLDVEDG